MPLSSRAPPMQPFAQILTGLWCKHFFSYCCYSAYEFCLNYTEKANKYDKSIQFFLKIFYFTWLIDLFQDTWCPLSSQTVALSLDNWDPLCTLCVLNRSFVRLFVRYLQLSHWWGSRRIQWFPLWAAVGSMQTSPLHCLMKVWGANLLHQCVLFTCELHHCD